MSDDFCQMSIGRYASESIWKIWTNIMEIREEEEGRDALGDILSTGALVVFDEGGEVEVGGRLEEGRNLLQFNHDNHIF